MTIVELLINIAQIYIIFFVATKLIKRVLIKKFGIFRKASKTNGLLKKSDGCMSGFKSLINNEIKYYTDILLAKQEKRLATKKQQALNTMENNIESTNLDKVIQVDFLNKHRRVN